MDSILSVLMSGVMRLPVCRTGNARKIDDPSVVSGEGRQCGRDHTNILFWKKTCIWEIWNDIQREREREREAQIVYL